MAHKTMKYVTNILGVLVVALLAWYLYENRDAFNSLKYITVLQIVIIFLVDTLTFIIGSLINLTMIHKLDPRVSFLDCFFLQYSNNFPFPCSKHVDQPQPSGRYS